MFEMKLEGFDELQRTLQEAQEAITSLDGEITTVNVNPNDPASVEEAIRAMEEAVDTKIAPYAGNPIVAPLAEAAKEHFRERLRQLPESEA
jgi:nucleotide-binding universal stress UspA family protein